MAGTAKTQTALIAESTGTAPPAFISKDTVQDIVLSMPMPNIIHAPFRPEFPSYNCKFDGVTNDIAGWTSLFSDLTSRGYGEVVLPDGISLITPNTLAIPSFCYMRGKGKDASVLQTANTTAGWLLKTSGTLATQNQSVTIQDIGLVRNITDTGGVLKLWYSQDCNIERVHIYGNKDFAIQCLQTWDTNIQSCLIESCGTDATGNRNTTINGITGVAVGSEVIQILGAIAASGDGSSTGNSNHIRLFGNSISGFSAGLLTIAQGANGASPSAYDIYIESNHFEALSAAGLSFTGQYVFGVDGTVNNFIWRDNFVGIDAVAAGSGTDRRGSMVLISCAAPYSTICFDGMDYQIPAAATFTSIIDGFTGGWHARRLHNSGTFWPSTAVLTYSSNAPIWSDIPTTAGVLPVSPPAPPGASVAGDLGLDDPANVSGLGAPAIIRGTVYAHLSGVTVGAGQTLGVRQANATALQAAITYAAVNDKYFEIIPNVYEISNSAGLVVPQSSGTGFTWRGSELSSIVQFYATGSGAPILTIGDNTGVTLIGFLDLKGVALSYGVTVTGLTLANALVVGGLDWSKMDEVLIGVNNSGSQLHPAYRAVYLPSNGGTNPHTFFSNEMSNITVNGFQTYALDINNNSTGSVWSNIYLGGGAGSGFYPTVTGVINMSNSGCNEGNFEQVNCEWLSCNNALNFGTNGGLYGTYFRQLHLEGIQMAGASPSLVNSAGNAITLDGLSLTDCRFNSANMTGTGSVISDYAPGQSSTRINKMVITSNSANLVNMPVVLYNPNNGPLSDAGSTFQLDDLKVNDSGGGSWFNGHLSIDPHMPVSSSAFLAPYLASHYEYGSLGSLVKGAHINVSATYTHYGQLENAHIYVPATITSFTIVLAPTMGASGNQVPRIGSWVHIRRQSGSGSGTLTIQSPSGSTLGTPGTTAGVDFYFQFTGAAYAAFTPVT